MLQILSATTLTVAGAGLSTIGFLILTYDQLKSEHEASRHAVIRQHIESLNLVADEIAGELIPVGAHSMHGGADLGEAQRIIIEAVRGANLKNRATALEILRKLDDAATRRRPFKLFALFLVFLGTVLGGIGGVMPQSSP